MKLDFSQPHSLDLAALTERINARVAHYAARYPALDLAAHHRWISNREVRGSYRGGEGVLQITATELRLTLTLPFFARPFRARIEDFVKRETAALLAA